MLWEEGPQLPSSFVAPTVINCGSTLVIIDRFFKLAFKMDQMNGQWTKLPSPITKRYEFGSFVINRTIYIVGGHTNVQGQEEFTQDISTCECLDLDETNGAWRVVGELPSLLYSRSATLGPTFAVTINRDTAIVGGLYSKQLFMFQNNTFSHIEGDNLKFDPFNMRHHKLVNWPFMD